MWSVFLSWVNSICKSRPVREASGRISVSNGGFSVYSDEVLCWELGCDEITRVVAFKRDLLTTDLICFGFEKLDAKGTLWCVHEEMPGFEDFAVELGRITDGAWPARFKDVAHPAFEECWTELWNADPTQPIDKLPSLIWAEPPECSQD